MTGGGVYNHREFTEFEATVGRWVEPVKANNDLDSTD